MGDDDSMAAKRKNWRLRFFVGERVGIESNVSCMGLTLILSQFITLHRDTPKRHIDVH